MLIDFQDSNPKISDNPDKQVSLGSVTDNTPKGLGLSKRKHIKYHTK